MLVALATSAMAATPHGPLPIVVYSLPTFVAGKSVLPAPKIVDWLTRANDRRGNAWRAVSGWVIPCHVPPHAAEGRGTRASDPVAL